MKTDFANLTVVLQAPEFSLNHSNTVENLGGNLRRQVMSFVVEQDGRSKALLKGVWSRAELKPLEPGLC